MDDKNTLHGPQPSAAELLRGEYGEDWYIFREMDDAGVHGLWVAERHRPTGTPTDKLTAPDIGRLRQKLEAAS
jgi:hypothetical protein